MRTLVAGEATRRARRATTIVSSVLALLAAGCDPGLPTDDVASQLRPTYLNGTLPAESCDSITGTQDSAWDVVPLPDDPRLVVVARDGEPICVDTPESVAERAAKLNLHLPMPAEKPTGVLPDTDPAAQNDGKSGEGTQSNSVGDDPIPVGKGDRVQEPSPLP